MSGVGLVALVGAGPGDPGLITVKALEYIKRADVIVYDRLVNPVLLDHAPETCELVYVGKTPKHHTKTQEEINDILVAQAKLGKLVVRLKGGDPFLFGRGGEEAEVLAAEGLPFEVIPGVSSAIAAPAYAGIPVTHRDLSSSVAVVTGHEDPEKSRVSVDWTALAHGPDTLVILMGLGNLQSITDRLIEAGKSPDTPVALIQDATTPDQKTVTGTLADIARKASDAGLKPPAVTVIGDVVGLRDQISWHETRPLSNRRILVTRARKQASALSFRLATLGAEVIELPAIEITQSPDHRKALEEAVGRVHEYDWAIFTSVNGVSLFFDRLAHPRGPTRLPERLETCRHRPRDRQGHRELRFPGIRHRLYLYRRRTPGFPRHPGHARDQSHAPKSRGFQARASRRADKNGRNCGGVPYLRSLGPTKKARAGDQTAPGRRGGYRHLRQLIHGQEPRPNAGRRRLPPERTLAWPA